MPHSLSNSRTRFVVAQPVKTGHRIDAPNPLGLWHLASLDAPSVAVVWTLAFAWAAGIQLPAWVFLLLALATWAVYIGDRLLDARSALGKASLDSLRERHIFHHRHRRVLVPIALAATCTCVWIVCTQMPATARERNSVLAIAALAYFTGVHSSRRLANLRVSLLKKELLVGILFTAACALPALARAAAPARAQLLGAAAYFALLAWLNCHAIDRWEARGSSHGPQIATPAGLLFLAAMPLAFFLYPSEPGLAALVLAGSASALLLALLDRAQGRLSPLALRVAADLALLTPLVLLLK